MTTTPFIFCWQMTSTTIIWTNGKRDPDYCCLHSSSTYYNFNMWHIHNTSKHRKNWHIWSKTSSEDFPPTSPLYLKFLRSLVDKISYSSADFKIVIHFPIFCVNHQCNILKGVSVDRRDEYSRIIPGQNLRSLDVDHEVVGAADCCYLKTHHHLYWLRTSKRFD